MEVKLFEHLQQAGLIKRNRVQESKVLNMPFLDMLNLLDLVTADTFEPIDGFRPSTYTHCASIGMGGGRDECYSRSCRLEAADELARFAALYSDQVIIHNYLADFAPSWGHPPETDSTDFRCDLIDDITILLHLRPLIESGRMLVFSPPATTCPYCYAKHLFGPKADKRLQSVMRQLASELYEQMAVELYRTDLGYEASLAMPEGIFRHQNYICQFETPPEPIVSNQDYVRRIESGESLLIPAQVRRDLGLHTELAEDVLWSIRYQMSVADVIGASFLTYRDVDLRVLSLISNDNALARRNTIAGKYLKAIVPFAADVPASKLLLLRQREGEAFIQFRAAFNTALAQVSSQQEEFTEEDAQSLYSDTIAPELARLEQKVNDAKRDLVKIPLASAVGTIAILAFGLYAGMVPSELKTAATALGLTKIMHDTISKTVDSLDLERSIRPEKFYFLWKVRHSARRTRPQHDAAR